VIDTKERGANDKGGKNVCAISKRYKESRKERENETKDESYGA